MGKSEIVTKDDLVQFKIELITELKAIYASSFKPPEATKRYIKSADVLTILGCCAGTLQKLRNHNKIPYFLDDGVAKFEYDDVIRYMEERRNSYRKNRRHFPLSKQAKA